MREKLSEKLKEFIKANVPQTERISGAEILEKAAEHNLEVIDHRSFYVIRPPGEKDAGLILNKNAAGPEGFVLIIYSAEDVQTNFTNDEIQYNPHFGEEAVIFRDLRIGCTDFWEFSQDVLFSRTKKVVLPESLCYLVVGRQSIEVLSSEAGEHLKRLMALEKQKKEEEERRKLAHSSPYGTGVM